MARPAESYRAARRNHARERRTLHQWRPMSSDFLREFLDRCRKLVRTPPFMLVNF